MALFDAADLLSRAQVLLNRPASDESLTDARAFRSRGRTVERDCLSCGAHIRTHKSRVKSGKDKYCSRACYSAARRIPRVTLTCAQCNKPFVIVAHHENRNRQFCGQRCHGLAVRGENSPVYKGLTMLDGGYVLKYVPEAERPMHSHGFRQGRYMAEHVYKAEKALGRCLRKGEVVHHINCDRADNRNENLIVCTSSYHSAIHGRMSRLYAQQHFARTA